MDNGAVKMDFGEMLAYALDGQPKGDDRPSDEVMQVHPQGAVMRLPVAQFAIIDAEAIGGQRRSINEALDFPVDRATGVLDMMTTFERAETRGQVTFGQAPQAVMLAESEQVPGGVAFPASPSAGALFRLSEAVSAFVDVNGAALTVYAADGVTALTGGGALSTCFDTTARTGFRSPARSQT